MTDKLAPLSTHAVVPSQTLSPPLAPATKDDVAHKVEVVEEEPYTIKCICNFSDDDGNTIYCETCDTWQHIDCFYPDNRDEAIREDFAHSCAECQPRPLNREKAIERTLRLRNAALEEADKKIKRPPSKSHKKKPKPTEIQTQGHPGVNDNGKHASPSDHAPPAKKSKSSHRPSQSVSSQPSKRSPSYQNSRSHPAHPPSPATTPPDLPDDFQIHHYSAGFYSLYSEQEVPDSHNNAFASLAIPTALSRWLREPDTMKQETGRTHAEVFQEEPANVEESRPKLEVKDATRSVEPGPTLRWRFVKSTTPIEKDIPLIELNGEIGFQKDYCADADNLWADLSSPLPFVFFHPSLPLYIDTRKEGSLARYVRRSCKPNAQLDTYLSGGSEYHFWLVSDRFISANEQITLPWDFRLEKSVCTRWLHLLGLSDDDAAGHDEPEMDDAEYRAISNWIDRILSEYGGCACDLDNNCAFARFHRHYLYSRNHGRLANGKKKQRKPKTHTISPTSTGHATNSRAASEGHLDDVADNDLQDETSSSRSKPPSRDPTPLRQGSFDQLGILTEPTDRDKRKVAMVEDSFRRMEQQQPPRKKKRLSDGTTTSTSSSKTKPRSSISAPRGQYVDAGTSRSKSGSPASMHSPHLANAARPSLPDSESVSTARQCSAKPRPVYCDASVQTDPVQGEWFSDPARSPKPKKRIISLSKRLLNSRYKIKTYEDDNKKLNHCMPSPTGVPIECGSSPINDEMSVDQKTVTNLPSPVSQGRSADASEGTAAAAELEMPPTTSASHKAIDLRVQLPPVPAFDSSGSATMTVTTPLSTTSIVQSPLFANNPTSPFLPTGANGAAMQPSPVKKKLSLSDYTKSRMNKSAGKVAGGTAVLKAGLSSPDDIKAEPIMESPTAEKAEEALTPTAATAPTTNGVI
ncbi:SET domain-containing protein 4 [Paramyrothecium foliicola]|nr:SET domain-containing protein 4 [Paramyrothecium foliicola]